MSKLPLDPLLKLLADAPPVSVTYSRCVHHISPRASCRLCLDHCPGGAVTAPGVVEPDKCLRCGLCQSICPTGAFALTPAVRQLLQSPAAGRILLGCNRQVPALAPQRNWQVLRAPCLAIFTAAWLLARALANALYICQDTAVCRTCPLRPAGEHFVSRLQHVSRLLAGAPHMLRAHATPEALGFQPAPAPRDTEQEPLNRRQFFHALWRKGRDAALAMLAEATGPAETPPSALSEQLNQRQEPHRGDNAPLAAALTQLRRLYPPAARRVLTRRERQTNGCYLCGTCAKLCPAGALALRQTDGATKLTFNPGRCLDCHLCQDVCLAGAIRAGAPLTVERFLAAAPAAVATGQRLLCNQCGAEFTQSPPLPSDGPLCLRCSLARRFQSPGVKCKKG